MNKQEENKEELLLVPKSKFCALCIHIDCESCDEVERYKSDIEAIKQAEREKVAREIIDEIEELLERVKKWNAEGTGIGLADVLYDIIFIRQRYGIAKSVEDILLL